MAFMLPVVERGVWYVVDCEDGGSEVIPADVAGEGATLEDLATYCESDPVSFERRDAWGARLSAPGYMDCTSWTLHDSEAKAREDLREQFDCCPYTGDTLPCDGNGSGAALIAHVEGCAQCEVNGACDCGDCDDDTNATAEGTTDAK